MQLIIQDGLVFATHDDNQVLGPELYVGMTRLAVPDGTVLEPVGDPPAPGELDVRPFRAPSVTMTDRKAALLSAVDVEAERQRLRWITPGAGQAMTYARKVDEAAALMAAGGIGTAEAYPMLSASVGIDGETLAAVAATVLAMDGAWARIGSAIERRRLGLKRDITTAANAIALDAIDITAGWPNNP